MLPTCFLNCGQGLGLAVPALQRSLQHLLCLQSSSSSSSAAYASKAKAEPPYKKDISTDAPKKKRKDAAAIPRALSAYAFFVKEQASARKGEGLKMSEMMKKLAVEWHALEQHEKQPYLAAAEEAKAASAQARADKKAARGPPSAYNIFCREVALEIRNSNPGFKGPELLRATAARWAALPAIEKEQRKADAQAAKDAWKAQLQQQQQ
jgi:hypothetical protein